MPGGNDAPKQELLLRSEESKEKIQLLSPGFQQIQLQSPPSPSLGAHIWAVPAEGSQELRELLLGNCSGALAGGTPPVQATSSTGWHQELASGFGHLIPALEVASQTLI